MAALPPILPAAGPGPNLRVATALNAFLPGAGLFYVGRRLAGGLLAVGFLACFLSVLIIFLVGYLNYWSLASENLMEGNKLEEIGEGFHRAWLLGLAGVGGTLYVISLLWFAAVKRQCEKLAPPGPPPLA